jgi:hypothetical protein
LRKNVFKLRKRRNIDKDKLYKDLFYYIRESAPRYTLSFGGKIWEVTSRTKIREVKIEDIPPTSKILKFMGVSYMRIDLDEVLDSMRIFLIKYNHGRIYLIEKENPRRIKMRYTIEELKEELGL